MSGSKHLKSKQNLDKIGNIDCNETAEFRKLDIEIKRLCHKYKTLFQMIIWRLNSNNKYLTMARLTKISTAT